MMIVDNGLIKRLEEELDKQLKLNIDLQDAYNDLKDAATKDCDNYRDFTKEVKDAFSSGRIPADLARRLGINHDTDSDISLQLNINNYCYDDIKAYSELVNIYMGLQPKEIDDNQTEIYDTRRVILFKDLLPGEGFEIRTSVGPKSIYIKSKPDKYSNAFNLSQNNFTVVSDNVTVIPLKLTVTVAGV